MDILLMIKTILLGIVEANYGMAADQQYRASDSGR